MHYNPYLTPNSNMYDHCSLPLVKLQPRHLIIIGVLSMAFVASFLIRAQPLEYGFQLHEFDPFFNYRATEYMLENGLDAYYEWNDTLSWYPDGRDISATSQVALHQTTAAAYTIFGFGSSLYEFTIIFPAVIGSMTAVVIFALVRVIGGTTAGLISSMLFAVSLPIIIRGTAGWFKSEPLGIFYGLLGVYLFLSGIRTNTRPVAAAKLVFGALFISLSFSAWGGAQFFILPLALFIISLPFLRKDSAFTIWTIPLFTVTLLGTSLLYERPGTDFIFGLGGVAVAGATVFLVVSHIIRRVRPQNILRNSAILLAAMLVGGMAVLPLATEDGTMSSPSFRYLHALNPFLSSVSPLTDSISEHQPTTISQSFVFHSILMVFAGVGVWLLLDRRTAEFHKIPSELLAFALIIGMFGVYVSSTFIRLEVFGSIAVIILSSLGISVLIRRLMVDVSRSRAGVPARMIMIAGISILLAMPLAIPNYSTVSAVSGPPTILNGASLYSAVSNDWLDTYDWIRQNTPPDAVIASWWDYGYWTQTLGERASIADNATIDTKRIQDIATMLMSPPDQAYTMLQDLQADYVMTFIMAERLPADTDPIYILGGGGDESKKQWFIRIAEEPVSRYVLPDGISGTDYFWDNTLLGSMTPYIPLLYIDPITNAQFTGYVEGTIPIHIKDIKYPVDGDGPLRLVYSSPSFNDDTQPIVFGIFVYEVNPNYIP